MIRYLRKVLFSRWEPVKVLKASIHWTDVDIKDDIWYYLYENQFGDRKIEIQSSGDVKRLDREKKHLMYLKALEWQKGFIDFPEIRKSNNGTSTKKT